MSPHVEFFCKDHGFVAEVAASAVVICKCNKIAYPATDEAKAARTKALAKKKR